MHHLCVAAREHFGYIHALTTANRRFFQQDKSLALPDVPVTEVPAWDLRRLSRPRSVAAQPTFVAGGIKRSFWGRLLRRLVDSFPFNVLVGDGGLVYILCGYRAGKKLIRAKGITHLFSTFRPYSDHVIAYLLKRRFPELYWIADFRDLHLDEKQGRQLFFWPLQVWFNRKILARTDLVSTVSAGLAEKLAPLAASVVLLRNGIPAPVGERVSHSSPFFSVVYTGRIYPDEQTAVLLFEVLKDLIDRGKLAPHSVRLHYAGPTPEYWETWARRTGLTDLLQLHGLLSLVEARQLQQAAAVNLSLSYSSAGQKGDLSSKIYEYLAAGRPILAIVNGEKDPELEAFFSDLQPGLLVYHDRAEAASLEKFLLNRYAAWQRKVPETWPKNQEATEALQTDKLFRTFFEQYVAVGGQ